MDFVATSAAPQSRRGRPTCCTEASLHAILETIRLTGMSDSSAAEFGEMSPSTLSRWKAEEPEVALRLERARVQFVQGARAIIRQATRRNGSPDWRAQASLLQTAFPEEYGYPRGYRNKRQKKPAPVWQGEDAWTDLPTNQETRTSDTPSTPPDSPSAPTPSDLLSSDRSQAPRAGDLTPTFPLVEKNSIHSELPLQNLQKSTFQAPSIIIAGDAGAVPDGTPVSAPPPAVPNVPPAESRSAKSSLYSEAPLPNLQKVPPKDFSPGVPADPLTPSKDTRVIASSPPIQGAAARVVPSLGSPISPISPLPDHPKPAVIITPPSWWLEPPPLDRSSSDSHDLPYRF